ncbi:hypothetical protein HK405_002079, partial [Cladochytrium tenue]
MTLHNGTTTVSGGYWAGLGLPGLDVHWPTLVGSGLLCQLLFAAVGALSARFVPTYRALGPVARFDWGMKAVSLVHALAVSLLSVPVLCDPSLRADKMFAHSYYAGALCAITSGYFVWDTIVSAMQIRTNGIGMVIHGIFSLSVFLFAQ